MSRSGYVDDYNPLWRGIIYSATRGKRGQRFFRELVTALDAMPEKRLVANELEDEETGAVCALGCLARAKGAPLDPDDTYDHEKLGKTFDIAEQLAQEVMYENDDGFHAYPRREETPEERWTRVRAWAAKQIRLREDELLDATDVEDPATPSRLDGSGTEGR